MFPFSPKKGATHKQIWSPPFLGQSREAAYVYWFFFPLVLKAFQLQPPRPAKGVSRALRARSVPRVSPRVSPKRGCPRECPKGCPRALLISPGLRSVQKVSQECPRSVKLRCPGHSGDTLGTLFGHSPKRPGTPLLTLPRTSGPKGPRDSCSRWGGGRNWKDLFRDFVRTCGSPLETF